MYFCLLCNRSIKKSDEDIPVPPLIKSAVLWGMYDPTLLPNLLYESLYIILSAVLEDFHLLSDY